MSEYTLSLSKWICGGGKENRFIGMGDGDAKLLNEYGYMCCIGQFASQVGISNNQLNGYQ